MSKEKKKFWSKDVETKWRPPEGLFEQAPEQIARGLKESSSSLAQAMERLDFYINRAGSKLSPESRQHLEQAKSVLHALYTDISE